MVRLTEGKIINLGQHMFIRSIQFNNWYEEYIVDTVNKQLLRVKIYRYSCDTLPIHHPRPKGPFTEVICTPESYTFFYNDNRLIKVQDNNMFGPNYFVKDSLFITNENGHWMAFEANGDERISDAKFFWIRSKMFIKRAKEPF